MGPGSKVEKSRTKIFRSGCISRYSQAIETDINALDAGVSQLDCHPQSVTTRRFQPEASNILDPFYF